MHVNLTVSGFVYTVRGAGTVWRRHRVTSGGHGAPPLVDLAGYGST